jgi:hypothetical protein
MFEFRGIRRYRVRFKNGKKTTVYTDRGLEDAKERAKSQVGLLTARAYPIMSISMA